MATLLLAFFVAFGVEGRAAETPASPAELVGPPGAVASPAFDAGRATAAYLATIPPDKKARSDAYFEGGYWL